MDRGLWGRTEASGGRACAGVSRLTLPGGKRGGRGNSGRGLPLERRTDVESGLPVRQRRAKIPPLREVHVPREAEEVDAEAAAKGGESVLQAAVLPEVERLVLEPGAADIHEDAAADAAELEDRGREDVDEGEPELRVHVKHVVSDDARVVVAAERVEAAEREDRRRRAPR